MVHFKYNYRLLIKNCTSTHSTQTILKMFYIYFKATPHGEHRQPRLSTKNKQSLTTTDYSNNKLLNKNTLSSLKASAQIIIYTDFTYSKIKSIKKQTSSLKTQGNPLFLGTVRHL